MLTLAPERARGHRSMTRATLFALVILNAAHAFADATPQRFEYEHLQMGTWFRLVIYAADPESARGAATTAFARVDALNGSMSDYLDHSELSQLTAPANVGALVPISDDLSCVLRHARPIECQSGGALDLTVGPLTRLWRQGCERGIPPDDGDIREAMRAVGYEKLRLDPKRHSATPLVPNMRLDLGAIAKGYAADCAMEACRNRGLTRVLVNAGGEVVIGDPPPDQEGWLIGLPKATGDGPPDECLVIAHAAVSTSGDQNQFLAHGGKRYSHVIDPRTGTAVTHGCTVTVVISNSAADGLMADALATAVNVLGPIHGPEFLRRFGIAGARIIRPGSFGSDIIRTPGFLKWRVVPAAPAAQIRDPGRPQTSDPSGP